MVRPYKITTTDDNYPKEDKITFSEYIQDIKNDVEQAQISTLEVSQQTIDLVTLVNFRVFQSRTHAIMSNIPTLVSVLDIQGYSIPGDGGGARYTKVVDEPLHAGKFQSNDGAWWELSVLKADLRMFGAKGDYSTNDTTAIRNWLEFFSVKRIPLHVSRGTYRCTNNFVLPKRVIITGDGAPLLASFPQFDDGDKSNLRSGFKHLINGSCFIFSGTPTSEYTTARLDKYSSLFPCFIYREFAPPQLSGFGIIQDMDVYTTAGVFTTSANDNKASGYTTGLLSRATLSKIKDLTIFGYFSKSGLVLVNVLGDGPGINNDPDYQSVRGCDITGGVAIIGSDASAPITEGNTGSRFVDCGIFGADHHNRSNTDPTQPCLFIDIRLSTVQQGRGHTFSACNFRTVVNDAIILGYCNDIQFNGCVTEFSEVAGITGLDQRGVIKGIVGATQSVSINGMAATGHLGLIELADLIADNGGQLTVSGGPGANIGSIISVDRLVYRSGPSLVVTNGSITPTRSSHVIDGSANPVITNIDPSAVAEGQVIRISRSVGGSLTFNETGNIALQGTSRVINSLADEISFMRFGANFREISYSDNA